jgi:protein-disulfide isomerase
MRNALIAILVTLTSLAAAQGPAQAKVTKATKASAVTTVAHDKSSALRPPAGSKVAVVIFEDLQCPDCARAHPLVHEVAKSQGVPVVRHDFPLPKHDWSFQAAVIARYFDSKSEKLGEGWRMYAYTHQEELTPENLLQSAKKYADANNVQLPFVMDPDGKLAAKVKADFALGQKIGIQHTPTIWVVGNTTTAEPFVEVVDRSQMSALIDKMKRASK